MCNYVIQKEQQFFYNKEYTKKALLLCAVQFASVWYCKYKVYTIIEIFFFKNTLHKCEDVHSTMIYNYNISTEKNN